MCHGLTVNLSAVYNKCGSEHCMILLLTALLSLAACSDANPSLSINRYEMEYSSDHCRNIPVSQAGCLLSILLNTSLAILVLLVLLLATAWLLINTYPELVISWYNYLHGNSSYTSAAHVPSTLCNDLISGVKPACTITDNKIVFKNIWEEDLELYLCRALDSSATPIELSDPVVDSMLDMYNATSPDENGDLLQKYMERSVKSIFYSSEVQSNEKRGVNCGIIRWLIDVLDKKVPGYDVLYNGINNSLQKVSRNALSMFKNNTLPVRYRTNFTEVPN
ncbi:hypothetical protein NEMIN01_1433 [Nematocida minor]|uniref:uncharacterized protein n=1 Tax=Nematocida minor TaxID=1912983 RepID=UPI0022209B10|nr:uncharacterized protein NEMIN01_1433 [Nematocida minor]KAI5191225.1 hypothetical protein NEMIN01_1433 [Nematocida minor]